MRKLLIYCSAVFLLIASVGFAHATTHGEFHDTGNNPSLIILAASNCAAQANALASSYGNATILSVTDNGSSCTIVIRVKDSNGGPPRIIRKTVSG